MSTTRWLIIKPGRVEVRHASIDLASYGAALAELDKHAELELAEPHKE